MAESESSAREREVALSKAAIARIKQFRQPATARAYAIWYNHASGEMPSLNEAVDALVARNGALSNSDIDRLYESYLSAMRASAQIDAVGETMATEIDQVMGMIEVAIGSSQDYSEGLAHASSALAQADREALRGIVEELIRGTNDARRQNEELNARLEASKQHIGVLQCKLETARVESLTDPVTSLGNRKQFDTMLDAAIALAKSRQQPLSLLIADIDRFKAFNDSHGHLFGDRVLAHVAQSIRQKLQSQHVAARYGGEEFGVILPSTTLQSAAVIADEIRKAVMGKRFMKQQTKEILAPITLSIGVAELSAGDGKARLVARADACLYAAKQGGRNRVVIETELPAPGAPAH